MLKASTGELDFSDAGDLAGFVVRAALTFGGMTLNTAFALFVYDIFSGDFGIFSQLAGLIAVGLWFLGAAVVFKTVFIDWEPGF